MHKMILAGYGGQGMLLCGQLLAYAAMKDGFNVTWLPSYGPEMRGGAAACTVVISEKPIGSPVAPHADLVAAMSQPAFEKYHKSVVKGGYLLYNKELVTITEKRDDVQYVGIEFSALATEMGNAKVTNMIIMGSINELLQCVNVPALHLALRYKFGEKRPELLTLNEKAIEVGMEAAKRQIA